MCALAMDMEWLVRLLLGLKMSPERLAVEAAWKRLLKGCQILHRRRYRPSSMMLRTVANAGKWKVARAAAWSTPTLAARPSAINIDHPGGLVKPHISEGWMLLRQGHLVAALPKPHGACSAADNAETKTTTAAAAADIKHRTLMASLRRLSVAAAHMMALAMEWILRQLRSPKMSLQRLTVVAAQMHALAIDMEWLLRLLLGLKTSPERSPSRPPGRGFSRDWKVKQLKSYHIGMSIGASKLIEIVRSKGNMTWEEVFLKAYNELTGEETKLWV
ncbi:hypothetical protein E2562_032258 [Oryza meyeriana var. granulata]|uniref:Uncharacterized protein n=1 Tax=Oryza meyeriana var. granulata TaxID=110450 RepID=A0A6G1D9V8_9ORYZ|nr:hypothetical protein E2562_032258 [Oryza meyeriana var. granulata]